MLVGIKGDIESKDANLEIYKKDYGNDPNTSGVASMWSGRWTPADSELTFNVNPDPQYNYFAFDSDDRSSTMFHELSHRRGTDDGESGNNFNNAHAIEGLMRKDFKDWVEYRYEKMDGEKRIKETDCCCDNPAWDGLGSYGP